MAKQRQSETEEQGAKHKKTMRECVTKQRQTEKSKVLSARRMIVTARQNNGRLKPKSNVINARRPNEIVSEKNVKRWDSIAE